ncbi:hypothetical protein [Flavobacterium beibuense]|uniref:hypothetical protein n=1 Tax=Flavobacterium beibuense TaxID=657326 RepID=UPI003A90BA56
MRLLKNTLFAGLFVVALSLTSCGEKKENKDAEMENTETMDAPDEGMDMDVDVDVNQDSTDVKVEMDSMH